MPGEIRPVHLRLLSGAGALARQSDFLLGAILLIPLLIPRLPGKGINAALFFVAFPVVAFFLLHGGGLKGFGVSWTANILSGFNGSIGEGGDKLRLA